MSAPDQDPCTEDVAQSVAAARKLFREGPNEVRGADYEPQTPEGATAAVEALDAAFHALPATARIALTGADNKADQISGDRLQGVAEIIQNADDVEASEIRVMLRPSGRGCELLVSHNGTAIQLRNVLALATPWLTTKADDSRATGRFGAGLMTLRSLSAELDVYSGLYHLRLGGFGLRTAPTRELPDAMGDDSWTHFAIDTDAERVDVDHLMAWVHGWDEPGLLFLRNVRSVTLLDETGQALVRLALTPDHTRTRILAIDQIPTNVETCTMHAADGRAWLIYAAELPSPHGERRAHKALGDKTSVAIAIPVGHTEIGQLHAGLPVRTVSLPFRLAAQFDPLTSRQDLNDNSWNRTALQLAASLWSAAVLDLFQTDPSSAWAAVPIDDSVAPPLQGELQTELLNAFYGDSLRKLAANVRFLIDGQTRGLRELAYEEKDLEHLLEDPDVTALSGRPSAILRTARDDIGRWRDVLVVLETGVEESDARKVTVAEALALVEDPERGTDFVRGMWACALTANAAGQLFDRASVPDVARGRVQPPQSHEPHLLVERCEHPLGAALRLITVVDPAFLEGDDGQEIRGWLQRHKALVSYPNVSQLLQRLAAPLAEGTAPRHLTDAEVQATRDALEQVADAERSVLGRGIGKVVTVVGKIWNKSGEAQELPVRPGDAYLIEREPDSWSVACGRAPGLKWLHPRYTEVLKSPQGRAGLGAQQFFRLLGAETIPRLRAHPRSTERYQGRAKGVHVNVAGAPRERRKRLRELGATYTIHDFDSPDLDAVLEDLTQESNATRRLRRSGALLSSLGRGWDRLREFAYAQAVGEDYNWKQRGEVPAWWLAMAQETEWVPNEVAVLCRPLDVRLRAFATLAIYGNDKTRFLDKDLDVALRRVVLDALGVVGDAPASELLEALAALRADEASADEVLDAKAGVLYQALATHERSSGRTRSDVPLERLRTTFAAGGGLVRSGGRWLTPTQVFAGDPVFGDLRYTAPPVVGTEPLWRALRIRQPDLNDCLAVLRDLARKRKAPSTSEQVTLLQIYRLLQQLMTDDDAKRLERLSVWTSQGWRSVRPVYAAVDPQLSLALGQHVPVWITAGGFEQFAKLLPALGVTVIDNTDTAVHIDGIADMNEELTDILGAAVVNMQADLALNDPEMEAALTGSWEQLAGMRVFIATGLQIRVEGTHLAKPPHLQAPAYLDQQKGALYVTDPHLIASVEAGGRAMASAFSGDGRRLSQAWLAAWTAAEHGHRSTMVKLAQRQAQEKQEQREEQQRDTLTALQSELSGRRATPESAGKAPKRTVPPATSRGPQTPPAPTRTLVDPATFELATPDGTLVNLDATRRASAGGKGQPEATNPGLSRVS